MLHQSLSRHQLGLFRFFGFQNRYVSCIYVGTYIVCMHWSRDGIAHNVQSVTLVNQHANHTVPCLYERRVATRKKSIVGSSLVKTARVLMPTCSERQRSGCRMVLRGWKGVTAGCGHAAGLVHEAVGSILIVVIPSAIHVKEYSAQGAENAAFFRQR